MLIRSSVLSSGSETGSASPLSFERCKTYNVYWEEGHTPCTTLGYAPQGAHFDDVMRKVADKAGLQCVAAVAGWNGPRTVHNARDLRPVCRFGEDIVGFDLDLDLIAAVANNPSKRIINSAITFDTNITLDLPVSAPSLQYTVYYNGSTKAESSEGFSPSSFFYSLPPVPSEYYVLQAYVEAAILEVLGGGSVDMKQSEARFRSLITSGGNGAVVGIAGPALLTCGATVVRGRASPARASMGSRGLRPHSLLRQSVLVVYHLVAHEKQQRQLDMMKM